MEPIIFEIEDIKRQLKDMSLMLLKLKKQVDQLSGKNTRVTKTAKVRRSQ